jgi:hypothetical protein
MENISYDEMLNKMSLSYFNGTLYSTQPIQETPQEPLQSYIYNKYFNQPKPPQTYQPKTKEEYIQFMKYKINQRKRVQQEQMEKRRLLISATNGSLVKVNAAPNSLFKLKMAKF